MADQIRLYGKVFIKGNIKAETGMHIGGGDAGINIGGLDSPVIRNPITKQPYIPGSSLKGKMRSLSEKISDRPQNFPIKDIKIHVCDKLEDYVDCDVCHIFGVPGDKKFSSPTRLIVRDVKLDEDSLKEMKMDLAYTEIKWEVAIDRVTSAASPRQIERVPEGAIFKDFELCYGIYEKADIQRLKKVFEAMQLVEDDYLGGYGTRGSGKIKFENITLGCRRGRSYGTSATPEMFNIPDEKSMKGLLDQQPKIITWLEGLLLEG
jgi:CRISPR-associated protein Csm3